MEIKPMAFALTVTLLGSTKNCKDEKEKLIANMGNLLLAF